MKMILIVPLLLAAVFPVSPASGQVATPLPTVELSFLLGPSEYDLSGVGTTFVVGSGIAYRPMPALYLEASVNYFQYGTFQYRFLFPEISIQAGIPLGRVFPYIGGGVGLSLPLNRSVQIDQTLHVAGGLRVKATRVWGVRGELRIRAINPFAGNTADFVFGMSRGF